MKIMFEFLRNILILELTLFIPGMIVIFGFMPDRLDIDIETESPLSVSVGFVSYDENNALTEGSEQFAGCLPGKNLEPVCWFFADNFQDKSFRLKFSGTAPKFKIKAITLVRNLLVKFKLPLEELISMLAKDSDANVFIDENGDFVAECESPSIVLQSINDSSTKFKLIGFELPSIPGAHTCFYLFHSVLLVFALVGLCVNGRIKNVPGWSTSLLMSGVGAFFFAVVLPMQTIFGNRDVFDFPFGEIAVQVTLAFAVCWAVFYLMLHLLSSLFAFWPHLLFEALIVYEYLHTGILSAGHPSLNGSISFYMNKANAIPDFYWLCGIFLLFILVAKWIRGHLNLIALLLLVMMVASLFDVRSALESTARVTKKSNIPWVHTGKEVANGLRLSPMRNVILLIPDSNQSNAAFDIMESDAVLRSEFTGFCAFNNNVGMHEDTRTAIPGILSGEWCSDPEEDDTYLANIFKARSRAWSSNSIVTSFERAGLPTYVITCCDGLAHSNRIEHHPIINEKKNDNLKSIFYRRTKSMNLCLMDILRFRVVPFILKQWSLRVSFLGLETDNGTSLERTLYPMLAGNPLSNEKSTALTIIHAEGSHAPVHFDSDGNRVYKKNKDSYQGYCGQVHFVMKCIAGFLNDLKRKGVYDKSLIIIVGDHGIQDPMSNWPDTGDIPSGAMPMLWVKPIGATGEFVANDIPTSHAKIAELVKRSMYEDLGITQISDILQTEVRYFRKGRDFDTQFKDMYFGPNGEKFQK